MNEEILSNVRNWLTPTQVVLEKMGEGEDVPRNVLKLALQDLKMAIECLEKVKIKQEWRLILIII
jgi:hypothetical protein